MGQEEKPWPVIKKPKVARAPDSSRGRTRPSSSPQQLGDPPPPPPPCCPSGALSSNPPPVTQLSSAAKAAIKEAISRHKAFLDKLEEEALSAWSLVEEEWMGLHQEKVAMAGRCGEGCVHSDEMLELNVGGQPVNVRRSILTQMEGSRMAAVFSGRWDKRLPRDKHQRIFVDENPAIFRMVVDHMHQVMHGRVCGPPVCVDPDQAKAFSRFLGFWGLSPTSSSSPPPPHKPSAHREKKKDPGLIMPCMSQMGDESGMLAKALAENQRKLEEEREALDGARKAWGDEVKFMDRHLLPEDSKDEIIYMSAMGYKLAAHREVVRCVEGSMLASLFDQQLWSMQPQDLDKEGDYFLEVSSYSLSKILDLLRQRARYGIQRPDVDILPGALEDFQHQVHYFFPGVEDVLMPPPPRFESAIMDEKEHQPSVSGWLPPDDKTSFKLLYRASLHGWGSGDFHRLCDGMGPTVVVAKTPSGHIFGGFTEISWSSTGRFKRSEHAYLFSLTDGRGRAASRIPLRDKCHDSALYHHGERGPCFGIDLVLLSDRETTQHNYSLLGKEAYEPPLEAGHQPKSYLAGAQRFDLVELEVFQVVGWAAKLAP